VATNTLVIYELILLVYTTDK